MNMKLLTPLFFVYCATFAMDFGEFTNLQQVCDYEKATTYSADADGGEIRFLCSLNKETKKFSCSKMERKKEGRRVFFTAPMSDPDSDAEAKFYELEQAYMAAIGRDIKG